MLGGTIRLVHLLQLVVNHGQSCPHLSSRVVDRLRVLVVGIENGSAGCGGTVFLMRPSEPEPSPDGVQGEPEPTEEVERGFEPMVIS